MKPSNAVLYLRTLLQPQSSESRLLGAYQRVAVGGAVVLAGRGLGAVSGLALNAVLARLLAPSALGMYYLALAVASLGSVLAQMGLAQPVVRLVAEAIGTNRPGRARAAVRVVFGLALPAAVITMVILVGVGPWLASALFGSRLHSRLIGLAALWAVAMSFQTLLAETLRGFSDLPSATLFGGLATSALSLGVFGWVWAAQRPISVGQAVEVSVVATGAASLLAGLVVLRRSRPLTGDGHLAIGEVLSIAAPQLVTGIMYYVLGNSGVWLLGLFRSDGDVAIYGAATRLVTLVITPLLLVNAVVMPLIAEMYAQGRKEELEKVLRTTATLSSLPAVLLFVSLLVARSSILGLLFGDYYRAGAATLMALSAGQLVNALSGSCGLTLVMTGHERAMMVATVASGVGVLLLTCAVARQYGPDGVAMVSALGLILQNLAMVLLAKWKTGMWTHAALPHLP